MTDEASTKRARPSRKRRQRMTRQRIADRDRDATMLPNEGPIGDLVAVIGAELGRCVAAGLGPVEASGRLRPFGEHPGGKLVIRQRLDYLRNCSAYVDRALFDAHTHRVILPAVRYERPPQGLGPRTITFTITVPEEFGPGEGEYHAAPEYHCNPLQRHYWPITRAQNVVRFQIERKP